MKEIVAFDFDGTLMAGDSFGGFARFARGNRRYVTALLRNFFSLAGWKLGFVRGDVAKERLFGTLFRGMPVDEFRRWGDEFVSILTGMECASVMKRLRDARKNGATTVIVSASLGDWIRPWASLNGVDMVIATEAERDSCGKLTGRFATPDCRDAEKVRRLLEHFPDRASYHLTAYGDSEGDANLLEEADSGILLVPRKGIERKRFSKNSIHKSVQTTSK